MSRSKRLAKEIVSAIDQRKSCSKTIELKISEATDFLEELLDEVYQRKPIARDGGTSSPWPLEFYYLSREAVELAVTDKFTPENEALFLFDGKSLWFISDHRLLKKVFLDDVEGIKKLLDEEPDFDENPVKLSAEYRPWEDGFWYKVEPRKGLFSLFVSLYDSRLEAFKEIFERRTDAGRILRPIDLELVLSLLPKEPFLKKPFLKFLLSSSFKMVFENGPTDGCFRLSLVFKQLVEATKNSVFFRHLLPREETSWSEVGLTEAEKAEIEEELLPFLEEIKEAIKDTETALSGRPKAKRRMIF